MNDAAARPPAPQLARVWDLPVRILHWALACSVAVAWLSTLGIGWSALHEPAGYVALAAIALRIVWGFAGSAHARFDNFVRPATEVMAYARDVRTHREARYVGHNPLGGWMVLCLLALIGAASVSGWLFRTDYFWGSEFVSDIHEWLAWLVLGAVVLHLAGVIFTSARHRENLVLAMISGRKRN